MNLFYLAYTLLYIPYIYSYFNCDNINTELNINDTMGYDVMGYDVMEELFEVDCNGFS